MRAKALYLFVCLVLSSGVVSVAGEESALLRFVLDGNDVPDFTMNRKPRLYGPESLWNYINGGAMPYLDYGVVEVITYGGIAGPDRLAIIVDVYDMADSLGAFGIYSSERFPEYDYLDIGTQGYVSENALCFWQGRYYVKVFTKDYDPPTIEPLKHIAALLSSRIHIKGVMPAIFGAFPVSGRVTHTESYTPKNVLGQDFLERAYSVAYQDDNGEYRLYLVEGRSPERTSGMFNAYLEFLAEYGTMTADTIDVGDESFVAGEGWYGTIVCVRAGLWLYLSVGLEDRERAAVVLRSLHDGIVSHE